jgi:hypothetical protein
VKSFDSNLAALGTPTLPTLASFLECIESNHAVMTGMYTQAIYESKQPSKELSELLRSFVSTSFFAGLENKTCFSIPSELQQYYQLKEYVENNIPYCMLIENNATFSGSGYTDRMDYGWPILVRPKYYNFTKNYVYVHLGAPHIYSDIDSLPSGALLFTSTKALSFLVQTRVKDALSGFPSCLSMNQSTGQTDALNSIEELYYAFNLGIIDWQTNSSLFDPSHPDSLPPCTPLNCGFIQWHETSIQSCYDAYISIGSGNTSDYLTPNPGVRIKDYFNAFMSNSFQYTAQVPETNDSCGLYGRNNLVGRSLNLVAERDLCDISVLPQDYSQFFVTIEAQSAITGSYQSLSARNPLLILSRAIRQTYESSIIL